MNQYLFTTQEGMTIAPDNNVKVDNCQLLARVDATSIVQARNSLIIRNPWILECKFNPNNCTIDQIITNNQRNDIQTVIDYLWETEEKSYMENNCPEKHIYIVLKRLRNMIDDAE